LHILAIVYSHFVIDHVRNSKKSVKIQRKYWYNIKKTALKLITLNFSLDDILKFQIKVETKL